MSPVQNERLVIGQMKRLYDAQATYMLNFGGGSFGGWVQLRGVNLIDEQLAQGSKYGYDFTMTTVAATSTQPPRFFLYARPRAYRKTGIRSFFMSNTCLVTGADRNGGDAGPTDPLIDSCSPTIAHALDRRALVGMRVIHSAEATYQATVGNGNYGTQGQLVNAGFLMNPYGPVSTPALGHYWSITPIGVSPQPTGFKAFATPLSYRETGMRSFFVDETGVIRGLDRQGMPANESDPPIEPCETCSPDANESTAKFLAKFLWGSERLYAFGIGPGPGVGNGNYGTLTQMSAASIFYVPFNAGAFEGYVSDLTLTPAGPGIEPTFRFTLTPQQYGVTGRRSFYIDQTGVLRGADKNGAPADASDPPVLL
jgi:hypothetical protein